jgi:hypothetical protein
MRDLSWSHYLDCLMLSEMEVISPEDGCPVTQY